MRLSSVVSVNDQIDDSNPESILASVYRAVVGDEVAAGDRSKIEMETGGKSNGGRVFHAFTPPP
jgi:hypothetical protein